MRKPSKLNESKLRGYRVRIYPNQAQASEIDRNISVTRAVYNLGLEMQNRSHEENNGFISFFSLITEFGKLRNEDPEYSWLKSISIGTIRETLHNLDSGFQRFFNKQNNYPKFKSRKRSKKNFSVRSDRTHIYGDYISISGLTDKLVYAKKHGIPENVRLHSTVVSFDGYRYWFSCTAETLEDNYNSDIPKSDPIGIDVGIVNMITTSDGEFYKYSNSNKYKKRLARQNRRLSKDYNKYFKESVDTRTKYEDIPKSKNHYKRLEKRFNTIQKIKNKHMNDIHTATKRIVDKNPSAIVIENISVRSQQKDKWMKVYTDQMCYYEIHRQLKYKAARRNIPIIIADKQFPSSQICSKCGNRGYLKHRVFKCSHCGFKEDRDLNAAYNLKGLAISQGF